MRMSRTMTMEKKKPKDKAMMVPMTMEKDKATMVPITTAEWECEWNL